MFRSSSWFMLVAVVVGGLLSLSTEAVAGQPACGNPPCPPTPTPSATTPTPTPFGGLSISPAAQSMPSQGAPTATFAPPTSLQQARDSIAAVAQQIGQVTRDTTLAQDAKVQQINDLAGQFNRLVNQLQQLDCGQACPPAPATGAQAIVAPATSELTGPPLAISTPASAQQARDLIVALGQQAGQVTQDQSLPQDAKVQQIAALAIQINQLQSQLQQSNCGTACTPTGAANPSMAAPPALIPPSPATVLTSTPAMQPAALAISVAGQQARDQIAALAQQIGQLVQDGTLTPDAKAQQINALATQFNEQVSQLTQQQQAP